MQYRKKPVVIEAFQMTEETRRSNVDWPVWLHAAWNMSKGDVGAFFCDPDDPMKIFLRTLEGVMKVTYGDFIIQGVQGELYACKPDIFKETYEPVY